MLSVPTAHKSQVLLLWADHKMYLCSLPDYKSRKATRHSDGKNRNKIYAKLLQMFHILFTDNGSTRNGLPLSCVVSDIFTTILLPRNHLRRNTATKLFVTKCTEPYCFVFLYAARCFFSVSEHHS